MITILFVTASYAKVETPIMEGKIGNYKIKMPLVFHEDSQDTVTGWYYYASKGAKNKIKLSDTGTIEFFGDTSVSVGEYVNGKCTGTFSGMIK